MIENDLELELFDAQRRDSEIESRKPKSAEKFLNKRGNRATIYVCGLWHQLSLVTTLLL